MFRLHHNTLYASANSEEYTEKNERDVTSESLTRELGKKQGSHINDVTSVLADFCDSIHVLVLPSVIEIHLVRYEIAKGVLKRQ